MDRARTHTVVSLVANEQANPGWTPDSACRNVLIAWLNGQGSVPNTWATLLTTLKRMGYKALLKEVEFALDAAHSGSQTDQS